MNAAEGILTARGGMTSHAAVVARGWGKTCVSGCSELVVDEENRWLSLGGVKLHEGDWLSLNGTTGEVIRGEAELAPPAIGGDLDVFMSWVDEFSDAARARQRGHAGGRRRRRAATARRASGSCAPSTCSSARASAYAPCDG